MPSPPKGGHQPKPKLTKQRLILYIISAVMIISLAASFLISNTAGNTAVNQNQAVPQTTDGSNLLTDPLPSEATENDQSVTDEEDSAAPEDESNSASESDN